MVVGVLTQREHSHSTERRGEEIKRCYDFPELREFCVGACIQLLLNSPCSWKDFPTFTSLAMWLILTQIKVSTFLSYLGGRDVLGKLNKFA